MQTQRKKKDFWPLIVGTIAAIGIIGSNSTGGITKTPRLEDPSPTASAGTQPASVSPAVSPAAGGSSIQATLPASQPALRIDIASEAVKAGELASVRIVGQPGVTYDIVVALGSNAGGVSGMEPKQADAEGRVAWEWRVPVLSTRGNYTVTVTGGGEQVTTRLVVG